MKTKNVLSAIAIIIGIIALAAGVAVVVEKFLKKRNDCYDGYIECDCTPEEFDEQ
ncbi:MAG: hypothetical protein U0K54_00960 [Acutalibacteraceae bacterium]|nr:hypothetical protein [Acutalibacteraceae bacterium]